MAKKASLIDKHPGLVISPYKKKKDDKFKYDLFLSFSSKDLDFVHNPELSDHRFRFYSTTDSDSIVH